ncbi:MULTISPECIES: cytochrome c biogenesis heme-transporting ATPase CcmA [Vibrio]|jgi:heme exporter protein A|uniref:Cytochrome c biogenesis heme-transporting ATPase CcmA n=5 Tax=Vibrio harveyi group TaxID=717610 RepID=A0A0H0YBD2_VIBAL|nr:MULTISPECIES: cytochrome c biogenesis heme-transporting ATPase CcmA [Vibrio]EEZ83981.1 heme exporter protein A [Vibrio alginolyticus 40B]MDF5393502.1 cytochrome c biogenesis heme-transporting ATPase CcmA [Vibrio parahaemolyticus]MDW1809125.1 cytochrome c biogenesis heme-transporting ATPase CcmA [Vibrio sp. Vb2362]MDW1970455.1 cytochrome c biogenesis heme-transporting ATPase CcmA [Vibrio sp. 945]MDW2259142.1 cytochrome c biogenesis heme-transporting ATPase CcmA [Vibrio sp. 1409]MDW2294891.1
MLEVSNLTAIRDERVLFENLQFEIKPGELVQIEGRNGTGKTTLLRIVTGLGDREEGVIKWKGEEVEKSRDVFHQDLLFLGHQTGVKRELTALENLRFYQSIQNNRSSDEEIFIALTQVGLAGREDVPVAQLSAGQQRRVALARLWLSKQILWILDEPLTAIDKQGVKVLESLFASHADNGGIVVLTTHQDMFADSPKLRKIKLGD